jgi:tRNA threonylcarbamoyladenosine biosynthesis protein TsaB
VRILAIEGALARCSAAVLVDGAVAAAEGAEAPRGHPALLPPMARVVLDRAGIAAAALDAVAVGVGPGGFTGLRAAIALAQGIACAAGCPLIGVTTGEALAAALPEVLREAHALWAVVDNRRGRVVLERFAAGAPLPDPPMVAALDALPPAPAGLVLLGDAAVAVAARLAARGDAAQAHAGLPDAVAVARVAVLRLAGRLAPRGAAPLYAEPPAVSAPAPAGP